MTDTNEMPDYAAALEALEWLEEHCWVDEPAEEVARSRFKRIRAALQSTRKPPDKCDGEPSTYWSTKQDFVHPAPVDTIAVPREVLQGVRAAFKGLSNMYTYAFDLSDGGLIMMGSHVQKFEDTHKVAQEALASLDAVLEGK